MKGTQRQITCRVLHPCIIFTVSHTSGCTILQVKIAGKDSAGEPGEQSSLLESISHLCTPSSLASPPAVTKNCRTHWSSENVGRTSFISQRPTGVTLAWAHKPKASMQPATASFALFNQNTSAQKWKPSKETYPYMQSWFYWLHHGETKSTNLHLPMLLLLHITKLIAWEKQQINTSLAQTSELRWSLTPTAQSANPP